MNIEAPPTERGGNGLGQPTANDSAFYSTKFIKDVAKPGLRSYTIRMAKRVSRRRKSSLERMAERLMAMPYNLPGTDKSFVSEAISAYGDYFSRVRRIVPR